MQLLRKIFFYAFLAIYLIICPILILYAFGYIFVPQEKGIVQTGLIYLSTVPPQADIYIDQNPCLQKTPAVIQELPSGFYDIEISLEGYQKWQHLIPVESGKASAFDYILLIPENWRKDELLKNNYHSLVPITANRLLISKSSRLCDYYVYGLKDGSRRSLIAPDSSMKDSDVLRGFFIEESSVFILYVKAKNGLRFLYIDTDKIDAQPQDITSLFQKMPKRIYWDPYNPACLFAVYKDYINKLDVKSLSVYPRFIRNVEGFGIYSLQLYVLKKNGLILTCDYEKNSQTMLSKDPILAKSLFANEGFVDIKPLSKSLIFFTDENGRLISNLLPYIFVKDGIRQINYHPATKRLLIWQKNKVGILDLAPKADTGEIFEIGPKLTWVYDKGKNIEQCFWAHESSHIVFLDDNKVYIVELQPMGKSHINEITTVKKKTSVFYSEDTGQLYYIAEDTGRLTSILILPKAEIKEETDKE